MNNQENFPDRNVHMETWFAQSQNWDSLFKWHKAMSSSQIKLPRTPISYTIWSNASYSLSRYYKARTVKILLRMQAISLQIAHPPFEGGKVSELCDHLQFSLASHNPELSLTYLVSLQYFLSFVSISPIITIKTHLKLFIENCLLKL